MQDHLAEQLDPGAFIPASARPTVITAAPPPPPPPTRAQRLAEATAGRVGLVQASLPELPYPLWLRAGTDDVQGALKCLDASPVAIPYTPRRILEIGAGAGYRSVALALAWPDAEILTTEPDPSLQRVALLNTLPYGNITATSLALSTDNARYGMTGRQGEAGRLALARDDRGPIVATQLKNLLYSRGWNAVDTVIITPDAASDHLLRVPWPASVRLLAVETGGAPLHEATQPRYPPEGFLTEIVGDYVLQHRRMPDISAPPVRPVPVFDTQGPAQGMRLEHIAVDPPGFFALGANGFRLHPNEPGAPLASVTLTQFCRRFTELHLTLRVVLPTARPVRLRVALNSLPEHETLAGTVEALNGGESRAIAIKLPIYEGACELVFTAEMAKFEYSNAGAWAEIVAAAFI